MRISGIEHVVLTTASLERCLDFYGRVLGLECVQENDRWAVHFGRSKLNRIAAGVPFLQVGEECGAGV